MRPIDADKLIAEMEKAYGVINQAYFLRCVSEAETLSQHDLERILAEEYTEESIDTIYEEGEKDNGSGPEIL